MIMCFCLPGEGSNSGLVLKRHMVLPNMETGITSSNGTAELGQGRSNKKELNQKPPTNVSDPTSPLSWGQMGHPSGAGCGAHTSLQRGHGSHAKGKACQHSLEENGLFFLNRKQTGVLFEILWSGCRQSKHGHLVPLCARHPAHGV